MKNKDTDITPVEGVDFYRDTVVHYLVSIDVHVGGFGSEDESAICSRAIENLRDGTSEGNAMIVHQEKIRDVELDMHTDLPFNRVEWVKNKLAELGSSRTETYIYVAQYAQEMKQHGNVHKTSKWHHYRNLNREGSRG